MTMMENGLTHFNKILFNVKEQQRKNMHRKNLNLENLDYQVMIFFSYSLSCSSIQILAGFQEKGSLQHPPL